MRVCKREHNAGDPADATPLHGDTEELMGGTGGWARGNHPPHLPPLMVTENRIWLHITEVYIQGVNLVNTEACIFPYNVEC